MSETTTYSEGAAALHKAADETTDAADHDELHAAGAYLSMLAGEPYNADYLRRWALALLVSPPGGKGPLV